MAKNEKKEKKNEEIDTETTIADMNVEGFRWYDPHRKKKQKTVSDVSKKEYRAMVRGAFAAMLPMICCIIGGALLVFLLMYLWLM
ncbi:MAG: hypothetical protein IKA40_05640 [Clostridia bacterium]|nr:hypothetical protein [Clostridia bacterium]